MGLVDTKETGSINLAFVLVRYPAPPHRILYRYLGDSSTDFKRRGGRADFSTGFRASWLANSFKASFSTSCPVELALRQPPTGLRGETRYSERGMGSFACLCTVFSST